MMKRRQSHNFKRQVAQGLASAACEALAGRVHYTGNPEHKRNPGDFGLTPPAAWCRPDKALCDGTGIVKRADAEKLLCDGARRGLVSRQWPNDQFPQNIWAVAPSGHAMEAQLENAVTGDYHGYPLPESDPFAEVVRKRWSGT